MLPYPDYYSLSESLLESYARFLRFFDLAALFWPFWMASSIAVIYAIPFSPPNCLWGFFALKDFPAGFPRGLPSLS